jgi:hypothetical protein
MGKEKVKFPDKAKLIIEWKIEGNKLKLQMKSDPENLPPETSKKMLEFIVAVMGAKIVKETIENGAEYIK